MNTLDSGLSFSYSPWVGNQYFRDIIESENFGWFSEKEYRCPADMRHTEGTAAGAGNNSYGYNMAPEGYHTEYKEKGIVSPSSKIMFMCSAGWYVAPPRNAKLAFTHWEDWGDPPEFGMPYRYIPTFRHSDKTNIAYFDCHVGPAGMNDVYFLNDTETEWDNRKMEALWLPDPSRSSSLKGRW